MKTIYYIFFNFFLLISIKLEIKNNFHLCQFYCSKKNEINEKLIDFQIKDLKLKAKIINETDICISDCKKFYKYNEYLLEGIDQDKKHYCTNGKDPKYLSEKDYLLEFGKGKCSPVTIIPGIMATKIEVVIDNCYKFKKNYPDIDKECNLEACSNKTPWNIYSLWVTDFYSPVSLFSINYKYIKCFTKFMKVLYIYDLDKNEYKLNVKEGLKVRVKGLNEKNGKDSNCGIEDLEDLTSFESIVKESIGFKYFTRYLMNIGYISGLTFQYLPYDFRLSYKENDLNILFKENIERLYKLNQKKVVIITHSLGSLNGLYQIKKNEKFEIYKKIGNLITVTPPYLGSTKTIFSLLTLYSEFYFHGFGIQKNEIAQIVGTTKSLFELLPDNPNRYKNDNWFKWVKNRIFHEMYKDDVSYKLKGADLLPNVNEKCYNELENNYCKYDLQNYFSKIMKFSDEKTLTLENLDEIFDNYSNNEIVKLIYNITKKKDLFSYNPKVQHTFIFLNSIKTMEGFEYTRDISDKLFKDDYILPDKYIYRNGDQTVPTYSVLLKAFKQAYEFENKENIDYKPVKIIEMCSNSNRLNEFENFYHKYDEEMNQNIYEKNSYNGINCSCENDSDKSNCAHSRVFLDKNLHNSLFKLIKLEEKVDEKKHEKIINDITTKELKSYSEDCVQLRDIGYGYKYQNIYE